jgi:Cd2+/Zn2+-exporting ATPase
LHYHLRMLSGDRYEAAAVIARDCGLKDFTAELLPQDKVDKVNELKKAYGPTIFVGDGVNDTPALVAADYSIAIGAQGKDIAMETADIVILGENLAKVTDALLISRKTRLNILENIVFALIVVFLLLVGVLLNKLTLAIGMLVHEVSVLLVIINAVRLNKYGVKHEQK